MAVLQPNRPVTTAVPFIMVNNKFPVGTHRFQLVVIDDKGNQSLPAQAVITIRPAGAPAPPRPQPPRFSGFMGMLGDLEKKL